ncbi:MAG: hypothetical protein JWO13_3207 [Acidobacteriales bacterium]|nr:hypothetical protein [Terriglobales bacterium]
MIGIIGFAYFAFFITSMFLSMGATWYVRNIAVRRNWIREGDRRRQVQTAGIPRLGGVGLFTAFNVSLALLVAGYYLIGRNPIYLTGTLRQFWMPAVLIFLLGLADDIFDIPVWVKFAVQTAAAMMMFGVGLKVNPLIFGTYPFSTAVSLVLTILWVVGITNAFNLIDGLDGLAAGSALFSTMAVFVVALISGNRPMAMITVGLTGAILGFLRFNFNPATIFLGDSGSLFVGFMMSAISLAGSQKSPTLVAVAIPMVACGLPILDTFVAIGRRFLSGKPIFGADRDHIHHKLLNKGMTHRQAVIVLYGISALFAFMSLFLLYPGAGPGGVVLAVLGIGAWLGFQQLDYREITELKRLARRTIDQKRVIANNLAVQYAAEHLPQAQSMDEVFELLAGMFHDNDFDGFELNAGGQNRTWRKPDTDSAAGEWNISLKLGSGEQLEAGKLTIYRAHSQSPLLVDINLITSDFHRALADAVMRISQVETKAVAAHAAGSSA